MSESKFVYITYIRTTAEKLWRSLIEPEFTRQYWMATTHESEWKPGASWLIRFADGRVADSGEIVEIDPMRRLVLKWRHETIPALTAEGYSRMSYDLEEQGEAVKLTLTHTMNVPESKFIRAVSQGWPIILSSLKSLLETGKSLEVTMHSPKGM
ncbi:MAG: SRPBCC family protein [Terracidiphilus sp.]